MIDHFLRLGVLPWIAVAVCAQDSVIAGLAQPSGPRNTLYPGNRAPLQPSALIKLPVGAVRPAGWLETQLRLQNDGFHGHLAEISRFLKPEGNAWLSSTGEGDHGWEEVPYWLKGFADCAYLLDDEEHIAEARRWIEAVLASQREDGFFGPRPGTKSTVSSTQGKYDLWPNMVMLCCLQSYYEWSGDQRVIELMRRYFEWEATVPEDDFLPPYWQQQRGSDNLWSVYWLFARTGDEKLLQLADKIFRHTADWTSGVPDWHNVNMAEAFGGPTFHWLQSGDARERAAAERNWSTIRRIYGRVPGGMFGGDENCRPGFDGPRQAIETCGMVEMMFSSERLLQVTGDITWADRCEDVAFNSLPAALTADLRALRYLTAPNQPLSDGRSKAPGIQNGGAMYLMDPWQHRCCQHNFGHGWPYFVEHLWMATPDNGVAAAMYGPSRAQVNVGEGTAVEITEQTVYPFRDRVDITVHAPSTVGFPLLLRVPGWCRGPKLRVGGEVVDVSAAKPGTWIEIRRTWAAGDTAVELTLPMEIALRHWTDNRGAVSVDRGPLTYSLAIPEHYVRAGGSDAWPAWSIEPKAEWNYGLCPQESITAVERPLQDGSPFAESSTPVVLSAQGKRIANWTLDPTGLVQELVPGPIRSEATMDRIELVPMGAARLRITAFPMIGGDDAKPWPAPPRAWAWKASASHCFQYDSVDALRDGEVPPPGVIDFPRFTFWDHKGGEEWVQYEFPSAQEVERVQVWWFDDQPRGGCAVPESWSIEVRDGDTWRAVEAKSPYGTQTGAVVTVDFARVSTTAIRLRVKLQHGKSGGLYEWRVE
ncbi:MAG: glycoside hydrolase family 127 protein [Planctomycetota bacterium]